MFKLINVCLCVAECLYVFYGINNIKLNVSWSVFHVHILWNFDIMIFNIECLMFKLYLFNPGLA